MQFILAGLGAMFILYAVFCHISDNSIRGQLKLRLLELLAEAEAARGSYRGHMLQLQAVEINRAIQRLDRNPNSYLGEARRFS